MIVQEQSVTLALALLVLVIRQLSQVSLPHCSRPLFHSSLDCSSPYVSCILLGWCSVCMYVLLCCSVCCIVLLCLLSSSFGPGRDFQWSDRPGSLVISFSLTLCALGFCTTFVPMGTFINLSCRYISSLGDAIKTISKKQWGILAMTNISKRPTR